MVKIVSALSEEIRIWGGTWGDGCVFI